MQKLTWILAGAIGAVVLSGIAALVFLKSADGLSARSTPSAAEAWLARTARVLAIPSDAKQMRNPLAQTPEILAEGLAHWADHCANCHANDGSGDTALGKGMYPPAPDMREPLTQQLSDGELFYIIENGIRLTGMPAWEDPDMMQPTPGSWSTLSATSLNYPSKSGAKWNASTPRVPMNWKKNGNRKNF